MYRILIVDNSPIVRTGLSRMTEDHSEQVIVSGTAANGALALEWLQEYYADVCITDIRMPLMDGLELIDRINKLYGWISNIVISSYDEFSYAKQSLELGAVDYLLKPVRKEDLYQVLNKAFQQIRQRRVHAANELLLKNWTSRRSIMDRWVDQVKFNRFETMPLLLVDTLELLEEWVGGRYDLLNPLAMEWLFLVVEELRMENVRFSLIEGMDLGLGDRAIPSDKIRSYFRTCCVRRLEEGAHHLFDMMKGARDNQTRKAIEGIQVFLNDNYSQKELNLQQIANNIGFSKNYMSSLFKQETGMTIWNYLINLRMLKARDMLLNTQLKLYEIADRLGYEDPIYFSRIFKDYYGLSPNEFKKRMEQ